jgi:hypothetical protein
MGSGLFVRLWVWLMHARPQTSSRHLQQLKSETLLNLGIASFFVLLIGLAFTRNVNWDEFYFLSHVHAWLDGRLDRPMQTFFVYGFGWLDWVSGNEVDQIFVARLIMVACLGVTCVAIYRVCAKVADGTAAKVAVLAFLASGFVLPYGASFRADPIAASLLMTAAALILTSEMRVTAVVVVAIAGALALLVTVKSVLYLPVFLGALAYRFGSRYVVMRAVGAGVLAVGLAALAYVWHAATMVVPVGSDTASSARDAVATTLLSGSIFPRRHDMVLWTLLSLPALVLVVVGLKGAGAGIHNRYLWTLALPLLSLVVYRNAFPYFFPFVTPPLMVLAALGAYFWRNDRRLAWSVGAMLVLGVAQGAMAFRESNTSQRATLEEVHRLFPTPVAYIDQHSMVATFPKQGFFMSTWGLQNYREAGRPVFADIIARSAPPLLLANREELDTAVRFGDSKPGALLPEDQEILRQSYVHYAGAIWLAGRSLTGTGAEVDLSMPMAGDYRIESLESVQIDGVIHQPGEVVALGRGTHRVLAAKDVEVRLVWSTEGDALAPPDLPEHGLYSRFWRL